MSRPLLIISTTYFPDPAVAAVRVTQWTRFLPERGWRPNVLCRHYGHTATPEQLAEHVHPDVGVTYLNPPRQTAEADDSSRAAQRAKRNFRLGQSALASLMVPRPAIRFWRSTAVRTTALETARTVNPRAIITSTPQHSAHALGRWLKNELNIPWIADFRDPYLIDPRTQPQGVGRLRWSAHRRFERNVYHDADLITHAIPLHARWARCAYPFARDRIEVLLNGFPPELLDGRITPEPATTPGRRSIRIVGALDPQQAMQLGRAVRTLIDAGEDLELTIVGPDPDQHSELAQLLGDRAHLPGKVPHVRALAMIAGADVLVSFLSPKRSRYMGLSSKLFEYLATGRPIIEVNPTRPDRRFLRPIPGADVLDSPDHDQLVAALRRGLASPGVALTDAQRRDFDRREQTARLARCLDELTASSPIVEPPSNG